MCDANHARRALEVLQKNVTAARLWMHDNSASFVPQSTLKTTMNAFPFPPRWILVLAAALLSATALCAQEKPADTLLGDPLKAAAVAAGARQLPGVTLAEGVSEITGVAVSPLLGVSAVGAWTWWTTAPELRTELPWYCSPYAWGIGLGIIALCLMKDVLGAMVPAIAKKPLDWIELFEDKLSALVASVGFVPLVALAMAQVERIQQAATPGVAMLPLASLLDFTVHTPWISIPVALVAFTVVWLSSHAINVLIAFSPFGIVDAGLKLTKLGILAVVVGSAAIHPWLGAAVSLVLILIGAVMAGWSLRLMIFGAVMGRDLILDKHAGKTELESHGARGFLARRTAGVPVRTYGRVTTDELGRTCFTWSPAFFLPRRSIPLEEENLVLCKGLVNPGLARRETPAARVRTVVHLLPRYRGCETDIAARFGCREILDSALIRGFKAVRQWLVDVLNTGRAPAAA
jgi:hypothetical protein